MSALWWLQPGWTKTCCARCGAMIYPEGDPDWGMCFQCFSEQLVQQYPEPMYSGTAAPQSKDSHNG